MTKSDNDTSIELVYCTKHNFGSVSKDSQRQKEHIENSKGKCKFVEYDPNKHISGYDNSEIKIQYDDEENLNNSKKVYDFAQTKIIKKVRSAGDHNRVYALVKINEHYKTIELGSWDSIQWIKSIYETATGEFYNDDLYKTSLSVITAHAINDEIKIEKIYSRIAFVNNEIFYDLCNDNYELVKITKSGYSIVKIDGNTPIFRRKSSPLSQIKPKKSKSNSIDELCNLLNIQQKYKLLFKVHLVSLFLESYQIPIIIFHGEQGSAKLTITSTIKKIIDPSPENLASMPKKIDDLNIHLYNRYISNFDNISYFDQEVSDNLCRAISGHTHIKRELYQDSKEIILTIQTRIILNGITPNVEFADLMQRSIFYETKFIPKDSRITEEEFNKKINSLMPNLLDQIFRVLSNTLSIYDSIKPKITKLERMADFTVFGECISISLGNDNFTFIEAYNHNLDLNSLGSSESHPIIDIVLDIFKTKKKPFEVTVEEIYNNASSIAYSKNLDTKSRFSKFPKTISSFSGQLTRFSNFFRNHDYEISIYRYYSRDHKFKRGTSIIKVGSSTPIQFLSKDRKTPVSPVPTCQDDIQAQNNSKTDTGLKNTTRANVSNDIQAQNNSKTDTGLNTDTGIKDTRHVSKKIDSSHKKDDWHGDTHDTDDLPTQRYRAKKIKSYNRKKKSTKSFNCPDCYFGNFINLDSKSILDKSKTYYNLHKTTHPKHKLKYSDEVIL